MTPRRRAVHGLFAGIGLFLLDVWPLLLIWRAGASGSLGDLSELQFLSIGLIYSVGLAVIAGRMMSAALQQVDGSLQVGRLDPWGAYATGIGVYNLAVAAVMGIMLLLLNGEGQSLQDRFWLAVLLWIVGHVAAAAVAIAAARALLGKVPPPVDSGTAGQPQE
jgi:hypothetical protein